MKRIKLASSFIAAAFSLLWIDLTLAQPAAKKNDRPSETGDTTTFLRNANEKLRGDIDVLNARAQSEFEGVPEKDLLQRLRVAFKYGTFGSQLNLLMSNPPPAVPTPDFNPKTFQGFLDLTLRSVVEFEGSLTRAEVQEIVSGNKASRFLFLHPFCSQAHRCASACTAEKLKVLLTSDPRLKKAPQSLQAVLILSVAIEDQFWPTYLPKLAEVSERKNAPPLVTAYYKVAQDFYGPKVVEDQKKIELSMYDNLRLYGFSGSNDEIKKTAFTILKMEPACGFFHTHTMDLVRSMLESHE